MTALINNMLTQTGMWSYFIVAGLLFVETGLVIMPFLPGDSLLFLGRGPSWPASLPTRFLPWPCSSLP